MSRCGIFEWKICKLVKKEHCRRDEEEEKKGEEVRGKDETSEIGGSKANMWVSDRRGVTSWW